MSDDDWDADSDYEPEVLVAPVAAKFADEDEEEVDMTPKPQPKKFGGNTLNYQEMSKEELVAELESRDRDGKPKGAVGAKARRKALKERERIEREEREKERAAIEASATVELTEEERYAQKKQEQMRIEQADLDLAKEFIGTGEDAEVEVLLIEAMEPVCKEDFAKLNAAICAKVGKYEDSPFYLQTVQDLSRDLCIALPVDDVRKVISTIEVLRAAKQKALKGDKKKKSNKPKLGGGKGQSSSRGTVGRGAMGDHGGDYADEYDDFM